MDDTVLDESDKSRPDRIGAPEMIRPDNVESTIVRRETVEGAEKGRLRTSGDDG